MSRRVGSLDQRLRLAWSGAWLLAVALVLTLTASPLPALAQADPPAVGDVVRVANTEGQPLNLRAGPSTTQTVVARLEPGTTLTVTGTAQTAGGLRWLPVRTAAGQAGWVADQFVVVVSTPTPTPTRTPEPIATPGVAPAQQSGGGSATTPKGEPLEVEAKLKYPEVKGREQEITVYVTRGGAPVPGVVVTLETSDGDDEEHFRQLDPTNEEGRTRRTFDVRHEKGTVELRVQAVAPDGGEGQAIVSYFRR